MLDTAELKTLAAWCAARAVRWSPVSRAQLPAVLLEPADMRHCWQRMVLSCRDADFELATEAGEPLASASDLHSVLDALEGGVAEVGQAAAALRTIRRALPAYVL